MHQSVAYIRANHPAKVSTILFVLAKDQRMARKGMPFLSLVLADSSGQIRGMIWYCVESAATQFDVGNVIEINGSSSEYKGEAQVIIDRVRKRQRSALAADDFPKLDMEMFPIHLPDDCDGDWVSTDRSTAAMHATQRKCDEIVSNINNSKEKTKSVPVNPLSSDRERISTLIAKYRK